MSLKLFDGIDLPHELLLTTRQKTKLRNAFNNNMSTDLKLSKAQISKIIENGGFFGSLLSNAGHDKISIRMMKTCSTSICKPLRLIFNDCIDNGTYPCKWKKANVPIHKKSDKQTLKNYRPMSLLPTCIKTFERLIYNEVFAFFLDKGFNFS